MEKIINKLLFLLILFSCKSPRDQSRMISSENQIPVYFENIYAPTQLTADLEVLTDKEKQMIPFLIEAASIIDEIFWHEAYGMKDSLLQSIKNESAVRFVNLNYGPWDRLNENKPFIEGVGEKPKGANFYPEDITKEEFEASDLPDKESLYTMIRRDKDGNLLSIPYHQYFEKMVNQAAGLLEKASEFAEDPGLKKYLSLRAEAFRNDDYQESDLAWMDMNNNTVDIVIGPIETYEDKLFGYKAAHEAFILIKDKEWSKKLDKYTTYLPKLQKNLPVTSEYKKELPGTNSELNVYDVIYYAGDCNAGSKTIAINLPNDVEVQLEKGARRLQLKNAMKAKFDKILKPIADELIEEEFLNNITFDAFFANTMFHEVAHGLGIKNTITGQKSVRSALQEHASALEEGKADVLGLYMIGELYKEGEIAGSLEDYYITFLAGIFRSVRFGSAQAHGKANMIRFNFFKEMDAFVRNPENGKYKINFEQMQTAVQELSKKILIFQGNGDYAGVNQFVNDYAKIDEQLQTDLDKLREMNIPVDIMFHQGLDILNL